MQVTVNGVDVDNGTWRTLVGESFGDSMGDDGLRVCAADFYIEGDTPDELKQRYAATLAELIAQDVRITFNTDAATAGLDADMSPGDGIHTNTMTRVEKVASVTQTAYRFHCRLYATAYISPPVRGTGVGTSVDLFAGEVGRRMFTKVHNAGRVESRTLLVEFLPTFDDEAEGPFTFTAVTDVGGLARFDFQVGTVLPAFAAGHRLKVASGTGYVGIHVVTAIDVANRRVQTDSPYVATATGSAFVGEIIPADTHYQAARDELLDMLGTDEGDRDSTTGLALVKETAEDAGDGQSLVILLQAEWGEADLGPEVRRQTITIIEEEPQAWHPGGGTRPVYLNVTGGVEVDRDQAPNLHAQWAVIEPKVMAAVRANTGKSDLRPLFRKFASDPKEGLITFDIRLQADNSTVLSHEEKEAITIQDDTVGGKAGRYDYDQRPEGLFPKTVVISVARVGRTLQTPLPVGRPANEGAATYRAVSDQSSKERSITPFGDVWIQSRAVAYQRREYEGSADVEDVA